MNNKLITIFQKYKVVLAYQFGSTVRNMQTRISDVDIAVLFEKDEPSLKDILGLSHELSLYFKTEKIDLSRLNSAPPVLKQVVATEGILLYEKVKGLDSTFSQLALKEYEDTLYLRKVYRDSLKDRLIL